jgi:hypothetical protein
MVGTRFCASATRLDAGNAALEWSPLLVPLTAFHGDLVKKSILESLSLRIWRAVAKT